MGKKRGKKRSAVERRVREMDDAALMYHCGIALINAVGGLGLRITDTDTGEEVPQRLLRDEAERRGLRDEIIDRVTTSFAQADAVLTAAGLAAYEPERPDA